MWKDTEGKNSFAQTTLSIMIQEESLKRRRKRVRGYATLNLHHTMYLLASAPLEMPAKARLHYSGTNIGNVISEVVLDEFSEAGVWALPFGKKKDLFGQFRAPVGGRASDSDDDVQADADAGDAPLTVGPSKGTKKHPRPNENVEPVFYHAYPQKYYESLIHDNGLNAVINLTAGDGNCAKACMKQGVSCISLCFTENHRTLLQDHLTDWFMTLMKTEGSFAYDVGYVAAMKKFDDNKRPPNDAEPPASPPVKKPKTEDSDSESDSGEC